MESNINKCPACAAKEIENVVQVDDYPATLFAIEKENNLNVAKKKILAAACRKCGHMFLKKIDHNFNKRIYEEYYYLYPFKNLESMNATYRKPFENVFEVFFNNPEKSNRLLEIGCSSVSELKIFDKHGFKCIGIAPDVKKIKNKIINGFYEDYLFKNKFDVIVSRFNLEHIINLDIFLKKVYSDLNKEGRFILQVPNVSYFLKAGITNVLAHEHPQYFCKSSILALLKRTGFEVSLIKADNGDASIIAVACKKRSTTNNKILFKRNIKSLSKIIGIINQFPKTDFVFYGAGLSLTGLLYLDKKIVNYKKRIKVVDDNKSLHGKFMPNSEFEICSYPPSGNIKNQILFILLNPAYQENILKKSDIRKHKKVFKMDGQGIMEVKF
jgi:SAM-dependent methyltransferase